MFSERDRDFHLARARAEEIAASRSVSGLARALHVQLAGLHAERARSPTIEPGQRGAIEVPQRRGMAFRAGLQEQPSESAATA